MITRRAPPGSLVLALLAVLTAASWAERAGAQPRPVDEPAQEPGYDSPPKPPLPIAIEQPPRQPYGLPPGPERRSTEAFDAVLTVELGGQAEHVDLDGAKTGAGGALGGRMFIMGYSGAVTYRVFVNGALGGQNTGFLTRFGGNASVGPAVSIAPWARLFVRIEVEADGHKDDELDASLFTLPAAYGGVQLTSRTVSFEIGPRAGTTLRAVYAPGDETEGRRHSRRSRISPSWGGTMALVSPVLLVEAGLTRVEQHAGLWLGEASACPVVQAKREQLFVLCAAAQYWQGSVTGSLGDVADVGSWVFGASVGFGFFNNKRSP